MGDVASLLSGRGVLPLAETLAAPGLSADQSTYVSELMGHAKAMTTLALLDPVATGDDPSRPPVLLARVSSKAPCASGTYARAPTSGFCGRGRLR